MPPKTRIKISLTPLALRALVAEAERSQESKSYVVERLLREMNRKQENGKQENEDGETAGA